MPRGSAAQLSGHAQARGPGCMAAEPWATLTGRGEGSVVGPGPSRAWQWMKVSVAAGSPVGRLLLFTPMCNPPRVWNEPKDPLVTDTPQQPTR